MQFYSDNGINIRYLYRGGEMKERTARLNCIKETIQDNRVISQETLLELLVTRGYSVTQATLSRDLKYLKVGKVSDGQNGYYYTLPKDGEYAISEKDYLQDVQRGFISYDFSGPICVVNTLPGHADSVALAIDKLNLPEILGTIAGDDTIFLVLKEEASRENVHSFFQGKITRTKEY